MSGVIFSIIAGIAMSVQGVMNTRLESKIGLFESNLAVQSVAFLLSVVAALLLGTGSFAGWRQIERVYLFGGVLGLLITVAVMLGIRGLGPTVSIAVILIAQLAAAALIDALGLLGAARVPFGWPRLLGLGLMAAGVLLIKWQPS